MKRLLLLPALFVFATAPTTGAPAVDIRGQYVEARTCDVFTGACFANADTGLTGKNAVLAWKVDSGSVGATRLDGLGVVAVLAVRLLGHIGPIGCTAQPHAATALRQSSYSSRRSPSKIRFRTTSRPPGSWRWCASTRSRASPVRPGCSTPRR